MATLQLIGAGVLIIVALVGIIVWASRTAGRASAEADALEEGESRRELFDNANSRPVSVGSDLIKRLRNMGR